MQQDTEATQRLLQAPWSLTQHPWMGWRHLKSHRCLVQWACSPLHVRCKPVAGGNRPEGSFQDARPGPAAGRATGQRRSRRDSPPGWHEGYCKGSGHQQTEQGRRSGRGRGRPWLFLPRFIAISDFKWNCACYRIPPQTLSIGHKVIWFSGWTARPCSHHRALPDI